MLSKIYLLLLSVFAVSSGAISIYAYTWLGSIGDPGIASEAYQQQSSLGWTFLWVTFLILSAFSLYLTWKSSVRWAVWTTMGYFVVFGLVILYNDSAYRRFLSDNSLTSSDTLLNPFFNVVMFLVVGVALVAAYMIITNMRIKIKGEKTGDAPESKDSD